VIVGGSPGLRWEVKQLIDLKLLDKIIFINPRPSATPSFVSHSYQNIVELFADTMLTEVLGDLNAENLLAFHIDNDQRLTAVQGDGVHCVDYEVAVRLLLTLRISHLSHSQRRNHRDHSWDYGDGLDSAPQGRVEAELHRHCGLVTLVHGLV
jgi:hypothetical protein